MSKSLPANPSSEQLKKQAKDLRKAHRSADPVAADRIKTHLPRLSAASEEEIHESEFSLQEAQHVIAREYGCKHWEMLHAVVANDFEAVTRLDDKNAQVFMRELDQADLVVALKGASEAVREKFLSNMSARVRGYMTAEIELCNADTDEIGSMRMRMLRQLAGIAVADRLEWPFWGKPAVANPSPPRFSIRMIS